MSQPIAPRRSSLGTCSHCFRAGLRITSGGVVYNHGPRSAQCPGTGRPPVATAGLSYSQGSAVRGGPDGSFPLASLPAATSGGPHQLGSQGQGLPPLMSTQPSGGLRSTGSGIGSSIVSANGIASASSLQSGPRAASVEVSSATWLPLLKQFLARSDISVVKWIPKSVRRSCAGTLTTLLSTLVANPSSELHWIDLFLFSKFVLAIPELNAKGHRTVASSITSRCREFSTTSTLSRLDALVQRPIQVQRSHRSKASQSDEIIARQVSRKLEDGNFRGAVSLVRSEDTFAPF